VNEVTSDIVRLVAGDARRRGVALSSELGPVLPAIDADRVCLQQVVLNLLLNAMDAMDQVDGSSSSELAGWTVPWRSR
jgi:C4-dicarboxylate-specific signal transduction histidine kinase